MARGGKPRKYVWGRLQQPGLSVPTGFFLAVPFFTALEASDVESGKVIRAVGWFRGDGSDADMVTAAMILEDVQGFPITLSPITQPGRDWFFWEGFSPVVTSRGIVHNLDLRTSRRMRERDRMPYLVFENPSSNSGAVTIRFSFQVLLQAS